MDHEEFRPLTATEIKQKLIVGDKMGNDALIALIVTSILGLIVVCMSIVLLLGKGSFLIAGFNTMSKDEKSKYDTKALCKFLGKILLPLGLLIPSIGISVIYNIKWIPFAFSAVVIVVLIFAVIYCNTGNRFKK